MRPVVVLALVLALGACARDAAPAPVSPTHDGTLATTELDLLEARIRGGRVPGSVDPRLRVAEERVARCMADAGFEYQPQVAAAPHTYERPLLLTRERAERHGYGDTVPPAEGVPPSRWAFAGPAEGVAENSRYRDSLAAEDLDAYWVAMEGVQTSGGPDGCQGAVMRELFADVVVPERFHGVQDALRDVAREVERDPRVESAVGRWTACMAAAGYPGLTSRHGGAELVADRAAALDIPPELTFVQISERFAS
ncbi:MAG: hypothetical protein M3Y20_06045, partial [Actinomycetota bacterium]|nr:hypothetical protein [Actinomycetota bacterium]